MAEHHSLAALLFLLLSLSTVSRTIAVFLSIDCGASSGYVDDNNIAWSTDELYISTGENRDVPSATATTMSTLRLFPPARKKNCYSIPVDKGERLLVRPTFYYGNYDGRSLPPTFDLQFDGNAWVTVRTSVDSRVYLEVIYVAKGDDISVCVAQTLPDNIPFISALEIRSLESDMYSKVGNDSGLFLIRRFNYGTNETVRFPDDTYDRIWNPVFPSSSGIAALTSDSSIVENAADSGDRPPTAVMLTAVATQNASDTLSLKTNLPMIEVPAYINLYFTEMSQLVAPKKREFVIRIGNESSDPVVPPYQNATEFVFTNSISGNTSVVLVPTSSSTLPPIISAMEVFMVEPLTNGTNAADVEALSVLKRQFVVLQGWSGDPCLPGNFTWEWVACSSDAVPRVTALYLNSFELSGFLPDFSGLDALQTIDLHNNSLGGDIPDFLGSFPNLEELNLADNDFSGVIPASITRNSKLKLEVSGNSYLCSSADSCGSPPSDTGATDTSAGTSRRPTRSKKKSNKAPVIAGVTVPVFVLFWVIVGILLYSNKRRKAAIAAAVAAAPAGVQGKGGAPHLATEIGFMGQGFHPNGGEAVNDLEQAAGHEYRGELEQQTEQRT